MQKNYPKQILTKNVTKMKGNMRAFLPVSAFIVIFFVKFAYLYNKMVINNYNGEEAQWKEQEPDTSKHCDKSLSMDKRSMMFFTSSSTFGWAP